MPGLSLKCLVISSNRWRCWRPKSRSSQRQSSSADGDVASNRNASLVWMASFLLGVSTFAPLEALCLSVDYYNLVFKGQQAAVRIAASYDAALITTQVLCYYLETRQSTASTSLEAKHGVQRQAGPRIIIRHAGVITLLLLLVTYAHFVAIGHHTAPSWALGVLILIASLIGLLDGLSLGAVYGEAGIVGPASAHAVVAGQACGFLVLATLRVFSKAVLPETPKGLRQSFCMFFAATALLLLMALVGYLRVVRPAVQEKLQMKILPVRATNCLTCKYPHSHNPRGPLQGLPVEASPPSETCSPESASQPDVDCVTNIREAAFLRSGLHQMSGAKTTAVLILPVLGINQSGTTAEGEPLATLILLQDASGTSISNCQDSAGPKYLKPGAGVFAITSSVMRDHWQFAAATVLTYTANFVIFPAVLGYVHVARTLLLVPLFLAMLYWAAPPAMWFCVTFMWSLSGWYEFIVFSLACDGLHPDDAYQVESLLAFMLQLGSVSGALLSLLLDLGPWALSANAA